MLALYEPILFVHIFFASLFMLSHGASVAVAFRLRHEVGIEQVRALLGLSRSSFTLMYVSLLIMVLGGVVLGFLGGWWSSGWIWTSLGLLVFIVVVMRFMASGHFNRVRKAAGLPYRDGNREHPAVDPAASEELAVILRSGKPHLMTLIGLGGWAAVLWLMRSKPF